MRTTSTLLHISIHIQSITCSMYYNEKCFRQKLKGGINKSAPSSLGVFLEQNVLKFLTVITILCISKNQHKHKKQLWPQRRWCMGSPKNVSVNNKLAWHAGMSLLASFSLFSTVKFPTRIFNNSCTLKDKIYINTYRHDFSVHPIINCISDHDAQIITLSNILISISRHVFTYARKIDRNSITKFTFLLSYENWEDVLFWKKCQYNFQ